MNINNRYYKWMLLSILYLSIIYSTSVHYNFGPERTINLNFFIEDPDAQVNESVDLDGAGILESSEHLDDYENYWKLSSFHSDSVYYLSQTYSLKDSIAPYKYRFLVPGIVGLLHRGTGISPQRIFLILNILIVLVTALLFTNYLEVDFQLPLSWSVIGTLLFLTMVGTTRTLGFPMLEPASFLLVLLIFIAIKRGNFPLYLVSVALGIAVKEVLAGTLLLYCIVHYKKQNWLERIVTVVFPVAVFMIIRKLFGGGALEVNYGFNILQGQIPLGYLSRLFGLRSSINLLLKIILAFCGMWIGLVAVKRNRFLFQTCIFVPMVVVAAIFLSSRIARTIAIVYPVIIPAFLLFLKDQLPKQASHESN